MVAKFHLDLGAKDVGSNDAGKDKDAKYLARNRAGRVPGAGLNEGISIPAQTEYVDAPDDLDEATDEIKRPAVFTNDRVNGVVGATGVVVADSPQVQSAPANTVDVATLVAKPDQLKKQSWFGSKVRRAIGAAAAVAVAAAAVVGISLHKSEVNTDGGVQEDVSSALNNAPVPAPAIVNLPQPVTGLNLCDSTSEANAWDGYVDQLHGRPATVWGYTDAVHGGSDSVVNLKVAETLQTSGEQISIPAKYLHSKAEYSRVIGILNGYSWTGISGIETSAQLLKRAETDSYARSLANQVRAFYAEEEQVRSVVKAGESCGTVKPEETSTIDTDGAMLNVDDGGASSSSLDIHSEQASAESFVPMREQGVSGYDPLIGMRSRLKRAPVRSLKVVTPAVEPDDINLDGLEDDELADDVDLSGLEVEEDGVTYVEPDDIVLPMPEVVVEKPASVLERIGSQVRSLFSWGKKK
ncbi:hypothetical protein A2344_04690 [Candidatus Peregrinibacteria bacterium RIFOXYB12_FULL_41_12]|nr:MAG: hypothetical protein A2344_04690 [Candidatus Peregrinibacteria bacterium RIFOXYB12_FULL_41_12]OGJ48660.1 MAG: hypothetical protein A2244_03115 [Candidatus Peregrinibacteria bacterium RIFOXYA2_FULL_41_18]OGJ52450.1 MAG: hypothetical protein A2448_03535 [Candidatus Peregrinibacteria bacterium RIFOXYC2_FULL_41_22]OGJ55303.1 MAG: hypothetical protein A2336_01130 [Candidatus Peregrinibacteria bacterium RIFOXYB2_FULL_41_88]